MKGKELLDKVADIVEETGIEERNEFWHRESSLYLAKKIVALLDYPSPPQDPEEAPASISDAELLEVVRKHLADVDQHGYIEGEDDVVAAKEITQFFHQYQHPKPVNDAELREELRQGSGAKHYINRRTPDGSESVEAVPVDWAIEVFHSHHKALSLAQEAGIRKDEQSKTELVKYDDGTHAIRFRRTEGLFISQDERLAELEHLTPTNKEDRNCICDCHEYAPQDEHCSLC